MPPKGKTPVPSTVSVISRVKAQAVIAAAESAADPRVIQVTALGGNPEASPPLSLKEDAVGLWKEGMKSLRKDRFMKASLIYLLGPNAEDEAYRARVLAARTGVIAGAAQYMASKWESELRPKTWIDRLTTGQQEEWAVLKRKYSNAILESQSRVNKAREEYQKALAKEALEQATQRQTLYAQLEVWGIPLTEVVSAPPSAEELLQREIDALNLDIELELPVPGEGAGQTGNA